MEATSNLFGLEQKHVDIKIDSTLIFEEIRKELKEYLLEQSVNSDLTDSVFDFLAMLSDRIQEEFDKLFEGDSNKKRFLRALTRIFALLLNTKVDMPDKIKKTI